MDGKLRGNLNEICVILDSNTLLLLIIYVLILKKDV
jgi:hypothetical protein